MSAWQTGLPEPGRKVLAFYRNIFGDGQIVIAEYIGENTMECDIEDDEYLSIVLVGIAGGTGGEEVADYDEATETYYWPAGWYECIENLEMAGPRRPRRLPSIHDLSRVLIYENEITHWMPLPENPK